ncbi:Cyanase [Clavulina sp. PMI_390]|nr:Cyanase [Clavulina sp. PMI_390]
MASLLRLSPRALAPAFRLRSLPIFRSVTLVRSLSTSSPRRESFVAATSTAPLNKLEPILKSLFDAKARLNLSFENIASRIGRDEIWVASVFYGQAKPTPADIESLSSVLEIDFSAFKAEHGEHWWPHRGMVGPMPPTDPVIYRLYEGVMVYGEPIKACMHEKFGDGIISMIDCRVHLERKADPKGDRAVLTFDGKFLPYATW